MFVKVNLKSIKYRFLKILFGVLFALFALSPCMVKGAVLDLANLDYTKPVNLTKTILQEKCEQATEDFYVFSTSIAKEKEKTQNFNASTSSLSFFLEPTLGKEVKALHLSLRNDTYLPKYILFKRLKIAIA